jgi:DNA modification methylase
VIRRAEEIGDATVHVGDCLESMRAMPDQSVHCCITSPPYFGLRDYGHEGQIGLEATPEEFVARLVEVFREVRRVLRDDGTCWLNLGDSYCGGGGYAPDAPCKQRRAKGESWGAMNAFSVREGEARKKARPGYTPPGLKAKDLIGIPWRVAFALQADGWYLRQDIIWHKPNPMPESVRDRCTKAHEYIFLLSKSAKYYFDSDAIKEAAVGSPSGNAHRKSRPTQQAIQRGDQCGSVPWEGAESRNRRSVWTVTAKPFKGAHFATFPPDLIEPCVLAGCPAGGTVLDPFGGSGTTAGVALKHGRKAVICELNPDYARMVGERISDVFPQINQRRLFA